LGRPLHQAVGGTPSCTAFSRVERLEPWLPNERLQLTARVRGVLGWRPAAARSVAGRAVGGRAILGWFAAGGS
jgi:hypothetical protein